MITVSVDLTPRFPPVRNQGKRPTCLGFATSDLNGFANTQSAELSVEYVFHHACRRLPSWKPDQGVTVESMLTAVGTDGQPPESGYPYQANSPTFPVTPPPADLKPIYWSQPQDRGLSVDKLLDHVAQQRPALLVVSLTRSFFTPDANGLVIHEPTAFGPGTHAILGIGAGVHGQSGERHMLIRNSWGERWGKFGTAWIPRAYLDQYLHDSVVF